MTSRSDYFCTGCNARFETSGVAVCPRCGAMAGGESPNPDLPTLLLRTGFNPPTRGIRDDPSIQELVGKSLHIYHCRSLLGRGGMGWVYLADHRDLQRACALKILSPRLIDQDPEYLEHFWNEGQAAAAIVHPNIITTHAIGECEGRHFLEMEYVRGGSLQQIVDDGPLPILKAMTILTGVTDGLAAAHSAGILHRDLKPDNVLMTIRGSPKLTDFGLAKRVASDGRQIGPVERIAGTPQFMAPELFQGHPATPQSDLYALGVCLFLMLTGRLPFPRRNINELMACAVQEPFPNIRDSCEEATLEIAECISQLTDKAPQNRPGDAVEALQLLRAVLGQMRDLDSLLRDAFSDQPAVACQREGNRYRLRVKLPDGRCQTVFVETSEHAAAQRLLQIFTLCGPVNSSHYEQALRLNAELSHGGIGIRDLDGQSWFVMVDTYPRATVDPEEIRKSVLEMARHADDMEERLTGLDHH